MSGSDESESRDERYERQTKEQYETLGRFVQAFELMVDAARSGCIAFTSAGSEHTRLLNVAFHHHSLTAQPLFHMWRGMIGEITRPKESEKPSKEAEEERGIMNTILAQMADEYGALVRRRNDFLHGTWRIGWAGSEQEDFSRVSVFRGKITKSGFAIADMPKDIQAMSEYVAKFESMMQMLHRATIVVQFGYSSKNNFVHDGKKWRSPDDPRAPKPGASPETPPSDQRSVQPPSSHPKPAPRQRKRGGPPQS